jgi:hypothetical protein
VLDLKRKRPSVDPVSAVVVPAVTKPTKPTSRADEPPERVFIDKLRADGKVVVDAAMLDQMAGELERLSAVVNGLRLLPPPAN